MTKEVCPVCKRVVAVSKRAIVFAHHDKSGTPCPMSGHSMGSAS